VYQGLIHLPFFKQLQNNFMSRLSKRHFWEWFKRHNKEYLEVKTKSKKEASYWLNELNAHLRAYFKFFGFGLTWQDKQTTILTITVKGKAKHFKKVEAFVATAPEIPGWRISALEDAVPIDFLLDNQMEDAGIHPRELYFSFAGDDRERADIIVYHPLCTKESEHHILELAYAAVYNLLGERSFGMDIGWLEVDNLSCADPEEIQKLEELPDCIGSRRSSMAVDHTGTLLNMHTY
jgi:hypothetical protein